MAESYIRYMFNFLKTAKMFSKVDVLPYDPIIPLLDIYPKEMKTLTGKEICTSMFTAALFSIAKTWKQPKCPLMDEWVKKL